MLLQAHEHDAINRILAERLAKVEARFKAELLSDLPAVNTLTQHVERYRGKMLRPTLVLAVSAAAFADRADDDVFQDATITVATVAEMVHMATLVHDDILDDAEMRRRGATINHLRGNEAAVMLGDYLISHAYHLCSSLPSSAASRAVAAATNTVCEGELLQLHHRGDWALTEQTYFEMIRRKTARLCGTCCQMPAVLAANRSDGGGGPLAEALFVYGEKLGIAFQIVDDVLDLTGDADEVGKSLGRDLAKGKLTLPLIRHLTVVGPAGLTELLKGESPDGLDRAAAAELRDAVLAGDGLAYAREQAETLVAQAKAALKEAATDGPARRLLMDLADAVVTRRA
ncbi:MAG: polyprenyl synthetase family protein [Algisphaera sp.]